MLRKFIGLHLDLDHQYKLMVLLGQLKQQTVIKVHLILNVISRVGHLVKERIRKTF